MGNDICLVCHKRPKRKDYQFCSDRCTNIAAKKAPQLIRVPQGHEFYTNVKTMFARNWGDKKHKLPAIAKIYLVTWSASQRSSFEQYRDKVFQMRKIKPKEIKAFRSERRACNLGDRAPYRFCRKPNCRLCPAIRTGFKSSLEYKRQMVQSNQNTGVRFGGGLYMAPSSNKAFDYAQNLGGGSGYVTVTVTRTALGKQMYLTQEQHRRLAPDDGYDSVKARAQGGPLEYITYTPDAARPAYLVMINKRRAGFIPRLPFLPGPGLPGPFLPGPFGPFRPQGLYRRH